MNVTKHSDETRLREREDRQSLVYSPLYDLRPGNGVGLFFQPGERTGLGGAVGVANATAQCAPIGLLA